MGQPKIVFIYLSISFLLIQKDLVNLVRELSKLGWDLQKDEVVYNVHKVYTLQLVPGVKKTLNG